MYTYQVDYKSTYKVYVKCINVYNIFIYNLFLIVTFVFFKTKSFFKLQHVARKRLVKIFCFI